MKFTTIADSRKKIASSTGILFLVFFSSGCVDQINQLGSYQTCKEAEEAVKAAQNQYNNAIQELANGHKDANTMKIVSVKFQSRLEAEEQAFTICNQPD